eukprot:scaffold3689_cov107-Skeletonema_dohrnii-CCMP3373.AAC.7
MSTMAMHIYRHQLRRFARNLSTAVDGCPNRGFAKRHPAAATQVLTVPPFSYDEVIANPSHPFVSPGQDESLERYVKWRGWNINSILSEHDLDNESISEAAIGLLSHPLTFPLTLGRHWTPLSSNKEAARLCCVGARAECTLPNKYWSELLIGTLAIDTEEFDATIDFVGPDVPTQLKSKTIALDDDESTPKQLPKCELTMNFHSLYLHEVVLKILKSQPESSTEQIKNVWDGFVLFNPGLGHPNLTKHWKPTLKFLIGTGKPILFTAHSTIDAERDRQVLQKSLADCDDDRIVQYLVNPYASRMEFVDPFSKDHVLSPNHSYFLLK